MRTILFVCTGNTCRSPMAEAVARHLVADGLIGAGEDVFVASAGVAASEGMPITREAVRALEKLGIESEGRSKPLTGEMVRNANLVLCMTEGHVEAVRGLVDSAEDGKVLRLDPDGDIEDPIGMDQPAYDALAGRLMDVVARRLKEHVAK